MNKILKLSLKDKATTTLQQVTRVTVITSDSNISATASDFLRIGRALTYKFYYGDEQTLTINADDIISADYSEV
ncbi:hypothetical protein ACPBEI_01165 [Latilactobacillus sakei]